jgi:hypothetical protein
MASRRFALSLACILGLAVAACEPTDPVGAPGAAAPSLTAISGPRLIQCPSNETTSTSGFITPLGGTLSLDGHSLEIPAGGLLHATDFTITEPASSYMEIEIDAGGAERFLFEAPVLVTISYARCSRGNIDRTPLEVWNIDPVTHELLENMGGVDDKLLRTVSFWTTHLSGYAIAE